LNPHAGESGHMGYEEEKIIKPVIEKFDYCEGPFHPMLSSPINYIKNMIVSLECITTSSLSLSNA